MSDAEITTLDIVTLVTAIIAVALAAASLAWQAATFVLSGSRVRVTLRRGAIRRQPGEVSRVSFPVNPTASAIQTAVAQGFTQEVAVAEVRNRGRLAVSVEKASLESEDGWGYALLQDPENPPLPHRLEPGALQTWHVELKPLRMVVDGDGKARRVGMVIELGTGKVIRTKKAIVVEPRTLDPRAGATG
jgi:hypothetical protein